MKDFPQSVKRIIPIVVSFASLGGVGAAAAAFLVRPVELPGYDVGQFAELGTGASTAPSTAPRQEWPAREAVDLLLPPGKPRKYAAHSQPAKNLAAQLRREGYSKDPSLPVLGRKVPYGKEYVFLTSKDATVRMVAVRSTTGVWQTACVEDRPYPLLSRELLAALSARAALAMSQFGHRPACLAPERS